MLGNKLLNIQFAKYHIWNNKSKGFSNMVLSPEKFNQSVRTEYSEAVNARYTFQPLWVSGYMQRTLLNNPPNNVAAYFLHVVEEYGGCPVDLVTDLGTEIEDVTWPRGDTKFLFER